MLFAATSPTYLHLILNSKMCHVKRARDRGAGRAAGSFGVLFAAVGVPRTCEISAAALRCQCRPKLQISRGQLEESGRLTLRTYLRHTTSIKLNIRLNIAHPAAIVLPAGPSFPTVLSYAERGYDNSDGIGISVWRSRYNT